MMTLTKRWVACAFFWLAYPQAPLLADAFYPKDFNPVLLASEIVHEQVELCLLFAPYPEVLKDFLHIFDLGTYYADLEASRSGPDGERIPYKTLNVPELNQELKRFRGSLLRQFHSQVAFPVALSLGLRFLRLEGLVEEAQVKLLWRLQELIEFHQKQLVDPSKIDSDLAFIEVSDRLTELFLSAFAIPSELLQLEDSEGINELKVHIARLLNYTFENRAQVVEKALIEASVEGENVLGLDYWLPAEGKEDFAHLFKSVSPRAKPRILGRGKRISPRMSKNRPEGTERKRFRFEEEAENQARNGQKKPGVP